MHVPPFMIASITKRCNLQCKGCYARAQHRGVEAEMSADKLRGVIAEARELGVAIILLAGGEPLTRPEVLEITRDYPQIVFPLFTNGLLKAIRESDGHLGETQGGCALWEKREWVGSLLQGQRT